MIKVEVFMLVNNSCFLLAVGRLWYGVYVEESGHWDGGWAWLFSFSSPRRLA
jgi:hypothetical protein